MDAKELSEKQAMFQREAEQLKKNQEEQDQREREEAWVKYEKTWTEKGVKFLYNFAPNKLTLTAKNAKWVAAGLPSCYLPMPVRTLPKVFSSAAIMDAYFERTTSEKPLDPCPFGAQTHVDHIRGSLERWTKPALRTSNTHCMALQCMLQLYQTESIWWGDVLEGHISELKIHFYHEVAFIDFESGKLGAIATAFEGCNIKYSITAANKNLAFLINQALMCGPGQKLESYKKSARKQLKKMGKEDKIQVAKMDMRFFYRMMNPKSCGCPIGFSKNDKKDVAVYKYDTLVDFALHRSLKSLLAKAKDYGVWSTEYVHKYVVPGGPALTEDDKKMTAGVFYPQACLLRRLIKCCDLGPEENWYVTEDEKKKLRDRKIPMDKRGLVKAWWQGA